MARTPATVPTMMPIAPTPRPTKPSVRCFDQPDPLAFDASGDATDALASVAVTIAGVAGLASPGVDAGSSDSVTAFDSPSATSIVVVAGLYPSAVALRTWLPGLNARFTSIAALGSSTPSTVTLLVAGSFSVTVTHPLFAASA